MRVEVQARREDTGLVRDVAFALGAPAREAETRSILHERISSALAGGLKALLSAAPPDRIDLDRPHDFGRETAV